MEPEDVDVARQHWRRQIVLSIVAVNVILIAIALIAFSFATGNPRRGIEPVLWPAVVGLVAIAVVLGAVIVHTVRVAAFTFRRLED